MRGWVSWCLGPYMRSSHVWAEELKTTAIELQDLVQSKVGTTVFANAYNRIRQGAVSVQQARRVARVTKVRLFLWRGAWLMTGLGDDGPRGCS